MKSILSLIENFVGLFIAADCCHQSDLPIRFDLDLELSPSLNKALIQGWKFTTFCDIYSLFDPYPFTFRYSFRHKPSWHQRT
jgi:hypothetical protein